jgi:demethylmenaquinone methyltransferase/2-methoxy-6-polyprenyl-1,4-benzoquinol methylase
MFARIASGYDLGNTVLSLGLHHGWRRRMLRALNLKAGACLLDCATGTGDVALAAQRMYGGSISVSGCDFCPEMLAVARAKSREKQQPVEFSECDVTNLPYTDHEFDAATIAFGIRNVDDPAVGIREMARVVKPGGTVAVLEFGKPVTPLVSDAYQMYSDHLLPRLGSLVTRDRAAYDYLNRTSLNFPCGWRFVELMDRAAPFNHIAQEIILGGIVFLYTGTVAD